MGVRAPVPHGVFSSSRPPSYIPKSVEDVRLSIDRVRLGEIAAPLSFTSEMEGSLGSLEGVGGVEGSADAGVVDVGVIWNFGRGSGRRSGRLSVILKAVRLSKTCYGMGNGMLKNNER